MTRNKLTIRAINFSNLTTRLNKNQLIKQFNKKKTKKLIEKRKKKNNDHA